MTVPTITQIIEATANHYKMPPEVLTTRGDFKAREATHCRQIAMYLARKLTFKSLRQVAEAFNQNDAGTVQYAFNRISLMVIKDIALSSAIRSITKVVVSGKGL